MITKDCDMETEDCLLFSDKQTVGNFKEIGIPDHLTCLLRKLYAGQEVTVRTGH